MYRDNIRGRDLSNYKARHRYTCVVSFAYLTVRSPEPLLARRGEFSCGFIDTLIHTEYTSTGCSELTMDRVTLWMRRRRMRRRVTKTSSDTKRPLFLKIRVLQTTQEQVHSSCKRRAPRPRGCEALALYYGVLKDRGRASRIDTAAVQNPLVVNDGVEGWSWSDARTPDMETFASPCGNTMSRDGDRIFLL